MLTSLPNAEAGEKAVEELTDEEVLNFWTWNDSEAAMHIRRARAGEHEDSLEEIAESLRESLLRDVVGEIEHRARRNPEWAKKLGRAAGSPRRAKEKMAAAAAAQREKAAQRAAASKAAWESKKAKARDYLAEVKRDFTEGLRSNPKLSRCAQQYLETALWSSSDEDGTPLDHHYSVSDFSPEAVQAAEKDCLDFLSTNDVGDLDEEEVGHNFWLTRNGHGTGFWDRDLGQLGRDLTKASKVYGSCDVYLGDDGKLHLT